MTIGATPVQCGNAPSAASSTSWTLTTTAAIDAGEVGVLRIAFDNISAVDGDNDEIASVSGGTGTWEKLAEYTNSQAGQALGVTVGAWVFTPSASNAIGTVFTITLISARTQKIAALEKYTLGTGTSLRQTTEAAVVVSQVDAGGGFGSSAYTGLTSLERLYLRVLGAEMSTVSSVSPTSGFTALSTFRSSTSSPISLLGEYRVNTSTGETSNPSFTPTADKAGIFLALEEYSLGGGTIIGTATATLDSLSAVGVSASAINTASSATLDSLVAAANAKLNIIGSSTATLGGLTAIAVGGTTINSSSTATLSGLTVTTTTKVIVTGVSGATLGSLTVNSTAKLNIIGTSSPTLDNFSVAAFCQITAVPIIGAIGLTTLDSFTASITAVSGPITATVSTTLGSFSSLGVVASVTTGQVVSTLGLFTVEATTNAVALPTISAAASAILGDFTAVGQASLLTRGTSNATLGSVSVLAIGQVGGFTPIQPVRYLQFTAVEKALDFIAPAKAVYFVAIAKALYFVIRSGQMQNMPTKYSEEIWLVSLDLSPWIAAGNTVVSFDVVQVNGTAICDEPEILSGDTGRWRISGGTAGSNTVFRALATMSDGQTFAQEFNLPVA